MTTPTKFYFFVCRLNRLIYLKKTNDEVTLVSYSTPEGSPWWAHLLPFPLTKKTVAKVLPGYHHHTTNNGEVFMKLNLAPDQKTTRPYLSIEQSKECADELALFLKNDYAK